MSLIIFLISLANTSRANHDPFRVAIIKVTANGILNFSFQLFKRLGLCEYSMFKGTSFEAALRRFLIDKNNLGIQIAPPEDIVTESATSINGPLVCIERRGSPRHAFRPETNLKASCCLLNRDPLRPAFQEFSQSGFESVQAIEGTLPDDHNPPTQRPKFCQVLRVAAHVPLQLREPVSLV